MEEAPNIVDDERVMMKTLRLNLILVLGFVLFLGIGCLFQEVNAVTL